MKAKDVQLEWAEADWRGRATNLLEAAVIGAGAAGEAPLKETA